MNLPDFDTFTDEELDIAMETVMAALRRRHDRRQIPAQIVESADRYVELGGDRSDLTLKADNA